MNLQDVADYHFCVCCEEPAVFLVVQVPESTVYYGCQVCGYQRTKRVTFGA